MGVVDHIFNKATPFNEDVCNGYALKDLEDTIEWLDATYRRIAKDFPPSFKYHYIERVSPDDEYLQLTQGIDRRCIYDISESNIYLVRIKFTYEDEVILRYYYLPYMKYRGGIFYLRGSESTILPVIGDRIFSVNPEGIFVILTRSKFNLKKQSWRVFLDSVQTSLTITESTLFNGKAKEPLPEFPKMFPISGHYYFCVHGVTGSFKRYYGSDVIICHRNEIENKDIHLDDWTIVESTRIKPSRIKGRDYVGTELCILIRRDDVERDPTILNLAAAFFYVVDHYPERFRLEEVDEPNLWRLIMAYVLFRTDENEGKLLVTMDDHFRSLFRYVDEEDKEIMEYDEGVKIDDLFDMMQYFDTIIEERTVSNRFGIQWGRYLMVKRYLLSAYTEAMVLLSFDLTRIKDRLGSKIVQRLVGKHISQTLHLTILKGHGEKVNIQYSGDNMLFKHTCNTIRQINAVKNKKDNKNNSVNPNDPSYWIDASILDTGSICNFNKRDPDGRARANPCIVTNKNGRIGRIKRFTELLDKVQREFEGENLR